MMKLNLPLYQTAILAAFAIWLLAKLRASLRYRSLMRQYGCQEPPKYPHKDPIFGLDLIMVYKKAFEDGNFLDVNKSHYEKYGRTFKANTFGTTVIHTADPDVSKAFHSTSFTSFGLEPLRKHVAPNFFGNGIIIVDGPAWSHARSLIRSSFDVVHIANFERLSRHTSRFMELLPRDGTTFDLAPLFKRLILDTTSEFIFGESIDSMSSDFKFQPLLDAFAYAQRGAGIRTMLGRLYFLHCDPKWFAACKLVTDFCDEHVDRALERRNGTAKPIEGGRVLLVDEMAKETQDRYTLRSQLIAVFSPAHDGAAVALTNTFFHLARHPEAYAKLRAEIMPTRDSQLTYELLRSYKYLHNCLRETHRLTTIATINQRECLETTVLPAGGGTDGKAPLLVQKGDIVEINYRAIHLDKGFWGKDADEYRPERWDSARPSWEFMPFGGGPRTCPGLRLVYTETAYVAIMIIREFEKLECRDQVWKWQEHMRLTAQSKNGAKVGLIV